MRYLFIVFLFLAYASTGQVVRTAGIALGTTAPTHTPTAQGALKYYNYSSGTTYKWYNSAWVVEATGSGSDDQNLDTFDIVANTLRISVEDDGVPFYSVDLSPYLDDTDTQLSEEQVEDYVGGMTTGNTVSLITVTYQDADGTIDFVVEPNLSNYTNDAGFLTSEVDGSVSNELQTVDTFSLSGTVLSITLSGDGEAPYSVDLVSLQDGTGTDDQIIDTFDIVANQLRVSIESDGVPFSSVDLSPYLDNTDTQDLSIDSNGNWYTISLTDGGSVNITKDTDTQLTEEQVEDFVGGMVTGNTETLITVDYQDADGTIDFVVEDDLSLYDNTTSGFISAEVDGSISNEIQAVDTLVLSGTTLGVSLSLDGVPQKTVDLASLQDGIGTDDQKIDTFAIVSNTLRLSVESDAEPFNSVDLTPYLDNTDTQDLSIDSAGDWYTVSLVDGGSVNLRKDTDTQLSEEQVEDYVGGMLTGNTETLISVDYQDSDGTIDFVVNDDLSLYDNTTSGFITSETDDQTIDTFELDGTDLILSLEGDAEPALVVDLSSLQDGTGTDNQRIDTFDISSNTLRISLEDDAEPAKTVDLSPYLDNTDAQGFAVTDDGTTFDFDLSGTSSDFALVEGTNITLTRTGNDVTISSTDNELTEEDVEDFVGGMVAGNTETLISVTYEDSDGTLDFVVEDDLALYDNTTSGFISAEVDGSVTNEIQQIDTFDISSNTLRASLSSDGVPAKTVDLSPYLDNTDSQSFSGSDDGTTFTLDLSGAATDIAFKEGSNVTITRTGTELTFASTGSADNWGTDVVNKNGTLTGDGTVASVLKVDTTVISTKDFVYKGKVTQESSETIKTTNFTAVKTVIHPVDCSAGAITVTPPSSPAIGDRFAIVDSEAQAATNNITIDFTTGSYKLYTAVQNYIINVAGGYVEFIYMGSTTGWIATKG